MADHTGSDRTNMADLKDFKDLKDLISSSSADSESEFKKKLQAIENHFVQKRNLGFGINPDDYQAMSQVISDGIPVETINSTVDACFAKYRPKHKHDRIRTFTYCVPSIYDAWVKEQSITEPVALGEQNPITAPVALGTLKPKQSRQMSDLEKFIEEEREREQARGS